MKVRMIIKARIPSPSPQWGEGRVRGCNSRAEGFSLVIVMVFIVLLSSLAIIAVKMSGLMASSMYGESKGKQAYYIAEAAYQHALFKLNQSSVWRGDLLDQPFAGGSYSLNISQASPIDDLTITAVGSVGGTERTIVRVIPPPVKPFIIVAFAGTGVQGSSGDNGPALSARFNRPRGLAFDAAENLYIADRSNHRIRKVNKVTGIVTKVAGTNQGFFGDGGLAVNARLDSPEGVAVNPAGNIYIADTTNCRARKVDAITSIITTYAGTGTCGYALPVPPSDGILATNARLNNPRDTVVDTVGNIYIADTSNCRIRKVDAVTGLITTFAGTGNCNLSGDGGLAINARINSPRGLAFDTAGNLYIADRSNNRIRKVNMVTKIITTVAGTNNGFAGDGGLATSARLNQPQGVAINQFGTIYIADTNNNRIRKVDPATGFISTYAGTGTAGNAGDGGVATGAQLNAPARVLAYDDVDGHLFVSDTNNNRVREVTNVY